METIRHRGLKCPFTKLTSRFSLMDILLIFITYMLMGDIQTEKQVPLKCC